MNILVVSPKFHPVIGGGETFVLNSVKKLHELGWQISVAVEPHSNRKISDYPFTVHELEGLSDDNLNLVQAVGNFYCLLQEVKPDVIHVHGLQGAFYAFVKAPNNLTDIEFVNQATEHGLIIVPGRAFSRLHGFIRISYGADIKTLERGLGVLEKLSKTVSPVVIA